MEYSTERYNMDESSLVPPVHQPPNEQPIGVPSMTTGQGGSDTAPPNVRPTFLSWFKAFNPYHAFEPYAKKIKSLIQMLIGIILIGFLLVKVSANIIYALGNPFVRPLAEQNPLEIVAYGLFFSTGIELAYMLFTDGPDEAIDPVMTGLAAAILLGIGRIDFAVVQQGITLFLAVSALAGLFAIKTYLYDKDKDKESSATPKQPVNATGKQSIQDKSDK
jgi:hypothetical protein